MDIAVSTYVQAVLFLCTICVYKLLELFQNTDKHHLI